jgi:hypothetical protein
MWVLHMPGQASCLHCGLKRGAVALGLCAAAEEKLLVFLKEHPNPPLLGSKKG